MTAASSHSRNILSALIPSAGLSSRMAPEFKPLLDMGGSPMIRVVIDLFHQAGVRDIVVVTGHNRDGLEPVVREAGAKSVFNPDYKKGMFTSIRAGAMALDRESRGFFLLPVDIPAVRPSTVEQSGRRSLKILINRLFRCFQENRTSPSDSGSGYPGHQGGGSGYYIAGYPFCRPNSLSGGS